MFYWWQWVLIGLVILFIIGCPVVYNLFGAEYPKQDGSCGTETIWQRWMNKLKSKKNDSSKE